MIRNAFLLLFAFVSTSLFAQKFTLQGVVKDTNATPLEGATVYVQSISDSVPISYSITNKKGEFSLQVNTENNKKAIFNIAYLGYKPYQTNIEVPETNRLNMGDVTLEDRVEELNVVSIIGKAPPVIIKKDTIEYNADSFKTLPNDKVEDLLKKLPGVEIDIDGGITVNGVEVEAVNVDGMRFFGEKNGEIAIKNIPSNAVSKVQVTDYKTDLQKFTGEESDSGTKEINLKIKKGKNKAYFGDVNLGYGTDKKYQANGNLFQLIEGKQLGIITGTNNINMSRGFNALPAAESSNGYIESDFIGANFSKGRWDETQVNANYRYSTQNRENAQKSYTENFLPDRNYITNATTNGYNDSDSHNGGADLRFITKPKTEKARGQSRISNTTTFNVSNNDAFSTTNRVSENPNGSLVSTYLSTNKTAGSNYSISNNFSVASRIGNNRDYFNLGIKTTFDKQDADGKRYSKNHIERTDQDVVQDQISNTNNSGTNINFYGRLNKEIFDNFRIIPGYSAQVNSQKDEKSIYDYNENTNDYTNFNANISNHSRYIATTIRPSLQLRYDINNIRIELQAAYTNTFRTYDDNIIENRDFKNDFKYVTYSGRLRYRDDNGYKNISLNYNQDVSLPSILQLQPVPDVSNITNVVTGNPDLKPQINHSVKFVYQNNIAYNNITISATTEANFVNDKITNATITDTDLVKYTTYQNLNGDYSFSGHVGLSKSYYNKKNNLNINVKLSDSYKNIRSLQNDVKFTARTNTLRPSIAVGYMYDKKIDINLSYNYGLTTTQYDTNIYNDTDYFVQNLRFNSSVYFFKNIFFNNKVSYRYNSRVGDDFDGAALFWNAGLGVQLWNEKATLTLLGYDILGKNNGYSRTVTETAIRDVENRILEQYFMLTFVYKFGRFAGQNINVGEKRFSRGGGSSLRRRG